jgi:pteridine reductase
MDRTFVAPEPGLPQHPVALVTGAAKRVGRAIALELAQAGHDIAIHHRASPEEAQAVAAEIRALGRRALVVQADLVVATEIATLFRSVDEAFGRLDVLVNCAAVFRRTPVESLTEADFDFHVGANLKGPYLCCLEAVPRMKASGRGCIVNITDVAARRPFGSHVPYCVSKAGLEMLTMALAKALAPAITVNAVAPGTVLFREDESDDDRRRVIARIPQGRIGTPEDIARAVRFLVESPHVTGVTLAVDGGRSLD